MWSGRAEHAHDQEPWKPVTSQSPEVWNTKSDNHLTSLSALEVPLNLTFVLNHIFQFISLSRNDSFYDFLDDSKVFS